LLEKGYTVLVNAGDDAQHFGHPADRFGGRVEVHCEWLDAEALLEALKPVATTRRRHQRRAS
jgi:hypothetical protein